MSNTPQESKNSYRDEIEKNRARDRNRIRSSVLATLLPFAAIVAMAYPPINDWVTGQIENGIEALQKKRARTNLLQQARLDQEHHRFQAERFVVRAEAIEENLTPAQIRNYDHDQDVLFDEVKNIIRDEHVSDIEAVRRVTVERYRYGESQNRVTAIKEDRALNCDGFTIQGAILFLRLGTPNIYVEDFKPIGNPPRGHVTLVVQQNGQWYDIRDGIQVPPPDINKLVQPQNILDYYQTSTSVRDMVANTHWQSLFEFPQQDFSYPGGVPFRAPPRTRANWAAQVEIANTGQETRRGPTNDEEFLEYMVRVWENDFVHQRLAPTAYGSIPSTTTGRGTISEIDFVPAAQTNIPSTAATIAPVYSTDLPQNPLEQTAEDATAFSHVFNQTLHRLEHPDEIPADINRGKVLKALIMVANTRLERANDLSPRERAYLETVIANARTEIQTIIGQISARDRPYIEPSLTQESNVFSELLNNPEGNREYLQRNLSDIESNSIFGSGTSRIFLHIVPYLFLSETRDQIITWIHHQGATIQGTVIAGLRYVLQRTVHPNADLERRIIHQMGLDQNPAWQQMWDENQIVPVAAYDQYNTDRQLFNDVTPLFTALTTNQPLSTTQKAAFTLLMDLFVKTSNPSNSPLRQRMQHAVYSAWYHYIGHTAPDDNIQTQSLWEHVYNEQEIPMPRGQLQAEWNSLQREVSRQ